MAFNHRNVIRILDADPDLSFRMDRSNAEAARSVALAGTCSFETGPFEVDRLRGPSSAPFGFLMLEGLICRSFSVAGHRSAELLGPGDVLRPWVEHPAASVEYEVEWKAVVSGSFAVLDTRFARTISPWPEITSALMDRILLRARWLAFQLAVVHERSLDERLVLTLWHFADRWGRRQNGGALVEVPITHALLADVVGAERPSVTTALSRLRSAGRVEQEERRWLLRGDPPGWTASAVRTASPSAA